MIKDSVATAKVYAKLIEEELINLMDAHNIDSIRRAGATAKITNL